jgi:hypothetical protein
MSKTSIPTKLVLVLLLLAGGGGYKWWLAEMSEPASSGQAAVPRPKWIHPAVIETMNRRMQGYHHRVKTRVPFKRKLCSYGSGDCCGPDLSGISPLPEPFGSSETKPLKLLPEFQVVRRW